ncbi:hypothetical protein OA58_07370 [Microcystis aeruginosa NIES-88]|nr:hypothetical protein OA58_07370 [Microcystis aeruginosa NIES-88]
MGFNSDPPSDQHPPYQGGKGGSAPLLRGESTKIKFEPDSITDLNLITDFIRLRIVNKIKYN